MKTLIYSNTGLSSWQFGVNTEVIDHLNADRQREIRVINCNSVLHNCFFNKAKNPVGCAVCQARQKYLLKLADVHPSNQVDLLPLYTESVDESFDSLEELVAFTYKGYPIGRGVASSIISYFRDYEVSSQKYGSLINLELQKSINVLYNLEKHIKEFQPEEIYLFNGRFAEVWPLILLAEKHQIKYYCIESGSYKKYQLFENTLPHSIEGRHAILTKIWNDADPAERVETGKSWFENRRNGTNDQEIQFTQEQIKKLLPEGFNSDKKNVAIFNSSEDEMKVIQEWQNDIYDTQNEAIAEICQLFSDNPDYHFYLRVHPNLGKVDNIQIREINEFNFPNLTVIGPNEKIDTYALLDAVDKVVTFGSSIGIETTYWNKVSIMLGKSFYSPLDVVYDAENFDEVKNLILSEDLKPKPKVNTLSYGYFLLSFGDPLKYFSFDGLNSSYYKEKKIPIFLPATISHLFKYSKHIGRWLKLLRMFKPKNPLTFK